MNVGGVFAGAAVLVMFIGVLVAGIQFRRDQKERALRESERTSVEKCSEKCEFQIRDAACRARGGDMLMGPALSCYRTELVP